MQTFQRGWSRVLNRLASGCFLALVCIGKKDRLYFFFDTFIGIVVIF